MGKGQIDIPTPKSNQMKFIDLGSGVGQVVLQVTFCLVLSDSLLRDVKMPLVQVAALTECQLCVGIEKGQIPSDKAVTMDLLFRRWMAWYYNKIQFSISLNKFDKQVWQEVFRVQVIPRRLHQSGVSLHNFILHICPCQQLCFWPKGFFNQLSLVISSFRCSGG